MNVSEYTISSNSLTTWHWVNQEETAPRAVKISQAAKKNTRVAPLQPVRQWLDGIQVRDRNLAHRLCQTIPAQCPFERDVKIFGHTLFHIPPMCKLNPLYEQVVALRFRALCYLADECGEDVTSYC
jgi:hypothetical protein